VRIVLWIVRILAVLLLLRMIVRAFFGRRRPSPPPRGPARTPERLGGELVQDPQCGTYIPKANAIAVPGATGVQYFCSAKCRDEYENVQGAKFKVRS
jgi:uncharacterized protein